MPETSEQLYARVAERLRMPPVGEWDTFPFDGRVHVCRWGDGGEHLHWWFMARPARIPQLVGSFAAVWDDVLPPVPEEVWRADLDALAAALGPGT